MLMTFLKGKHKFAKKLAVTKISYSNYLGSRKSSCGMLELVDSCQTVFYATK